MNDASRAIAGKLKSFETSGTTFSSRHPIVPAKDQCGSNLRTCFLLTLLILFALPSLAQAPADIWSSGGRHPVEVTANTNCSECHSYLLKGKYVHTAVSMGCPTCHAVTNKADGTYVELVSPVNQICLTCHPLSSEKLQHGPYKRGDCVICHSPHSSDFPQHTWVEHQNLCLGCHTHERLKLYTATHTGLLPWGITLNAAQTKGLPFLRLNRNLTKNHPLQGHPVSGPNKPAGRDAPPVTCLSCHNPHASGFPFLYAMPDNWETYPCPNCLICMKCHRPTDLGY